MGLLVGRIAPRNVSRLPVKLFDGVSSVRRYFARCCVVHVSLSPGVWAFRAVPLAGRRGFSVVPRRRLNTKLTPRGPRKNPRGQQKNKKKRGFGTFSKGFRVVFGVVLINFYIRKKHEMRSIRFFQNLALDVYGVESYFYTVYRENTKRFRLTRNFTGANAPVIFIYNKVSSFVNTPLCLIQTSPFVSTLKASEREPPEAPNPTTNNAS